ncbi:glycine--tRNA ligase-like, partial [Anneissia japonica]|uniref:glycine--tRNA ligase-like n=1 Tax=Anneissia japonica TaxID=1529436 RepID=UPI0014254F24
MSGKDHLRKVLTLCKYHGFFQQAHVLNQNSVTGCYDYGPLGTDLKRNIENEWWHSVVSAKENMFGVDCSSLHVQPTNHSHDNQLEVAVPQLKVTAQQGSNESEEFTTGQSSANHWFLQSTFSN